MCRRPPAPCGVAPDCRHRPRQGRRPRISSGRVDPPGGQNAVSRKWPGRSSRRGRDAPVPVQRHGLSARCHPRRSATTAVRSLTASQNPDRIRMGSADARELALSHSRAMSRSRMAPEPQTPPGADANVLPDWLRSRDLSSIGRPKPPTDPGPAPPQPTHLTIPEVAKRLQVSTRTVSRWIASGALSRVQIGRVVRVPAEALDVLVQARKIS